MRHQLTVLFGKGVKKAAEMRGGGSALPGLFVEKIDADFTRRTLARLPRGVVLISGTNGKTTTTKMVVELLESQGLRVFTNRTGSNFTRGVAAALLGDVDRRGRLKADIAVLELDEAYAVHFVRSIPPNYCLLLNVMRDQLDRFGEIDHTAKLLHTIAMHTTEGIVLNRDDTRLGSPHFTESLRTPFHTYGVSAALQSEFPQDDALYGSTERPQSTHLSSDDTVLQSLSKQQATISFAGATHTVNLKLKGIYNVQNAVGAIAVTRMVMGDVLETEAMLGALSRVEPAFGRGETIKIGDVECELILVKNPAGFRLGLKSFDSNTADTMIAINDDYADGRDMSWLWDVDFTSLSGGVSMVSGLRAYDMALRLQYDEIPVSQVEPVLSKALDAFLSSNGHEHRLKRIFCTYTAMLSLRHELAKRTKVETVR